jgi:hypothetical protein
VWRKAKNGWVVNSQNINLWDRGKYVTSQPSEAMIALELFLRETGFFEEVGEFGDLFLHIMETPQVGEEKVVIAVLCTSDSLRVLSSTGGLTVARSWTSPSAMEYSMGAVQQGWR